MMTQPTETVEVENGDETIDVPLTFERVDLAAWFGAVPETFEVHRIFRYDDRVHVEALADGKVIEAAYYPEGGHEFAQNDYGWIADDTGADPEDLFNFDVGETLWRRGDDSEPMTESEYLDAVRNAIPSGYQEWDVNRFSDTEGDHVDVVLCREDDRDELVNTEGVESVPMACVAWVDGGGECVVFVGEGSLDSYDVSSHVSTHGDVETAVDEACAILDERAAA